MKLLQWFKMLRGAQTRCHLARATQYCLRALVSLKLCSVGLLFSLHDFVFDTGANCKRAPWIGNPGRAQSLQFKTEGSIDRVHGLVLHNTAWGKIQTSTFFLLFFKLQLKAAPHQSVSFIMSDYRAAAHVLSFTHLHELFIKRWCCVFKYSIKHNSARGVTSRVDVIALGFGLII